MTNYIPADKLIAEIEKHIKHYESSNRDDFKNGELYICQEILSFIDSLQQEQSEVDLKKIIEQTYHDGSVADTDDMDHATYENIARHFFELGQKEMRKRLSNPEYNKKVIERMKSDYPDSKEESK